MTQCYMIVWLLYWNAVPGRNGIHLSAGFFSPASIGNLASKPHYNNNNKQSSKIRT